MAGRVQLIDSKASWAETDDGVVILNLETSRYLTVNATGRVLWGRLREGVDPTELVELLVDTFHIDRVQAQSDLTAFLTALRDEGLLRLEDS